jgi:CYTH domain-containing protein
VGDLEVERKFLVRTVPAGLTSIRVEDVVQGYVTVTPEAEVRLRRKGDRCFLTVKGGGDLVRAEREISLAAAQLEELWPAVGERIVEKQRLVVEHEGALLEIDRYRGRLAGLITVEVEFDSVESARAWTPPSWFGPEVTRDSRYKNRNLAVHGRPPSTETPAGE